ncbi:unnamed protein product [Didymodactylos carnosus]|uniref:Fibronectin type III-like domain-containing protein n=1 Tax=Didymodactylos carnosus TaxID=1234261 RepID=A0A814E3V4_9BILA|nr:unnamed protein product [Didymodactylos carnosus]CAF1013478.1 unnamed protein product [Didymodactylos carnosus]CAF3737060.1 unnamed protein product [Didymodactylos carnosus]CAF3782447.1 unnamed protein product [Didymodactylos carnosus]
MTTLLMFTISLNAIISAVVPLPFPDCQKGPLAAYPICDASLSYRVRAMDLISRMTTTEKITQMVNTAPAIERLGLPGYEWWSEALHGIAYSPGVSFGGDFPSATSFPMPINLGASFNTRIVYQIAQIISTEARAFSNAGRAGLTYFTPNINIFRDPRWGRGQETPGEDPFLTSRYVYALIDGLQKGDDPRYLKIAADCKHFNAYDLENWNGTDRFHFDAIVTDQDLVETFLPPFESCIRDAHVASIMCSYNAINGVPSCANTFELQKIARESYHLDGFVVSDCGAVGTIMDTHHYTKTVQDTVAVALHAGTDLNCGDFYLKHTADALSNKTIVEADIDQALQRNFEVLIRLGYFDSPDGQPYRKYSKTDVNTDVAQVLSVQAAHESIVLLKNQNNGLPLKVDTMAGKKVALIGPTANATILQQGNYYGAAPYIINPIVGFQAVTAGKDIDVQFAYGCEIAGTDTSGFEAALQLARSADYVFFFGGLNQSIEAEGLDRTSITLPGVQMTLLEQVANISKAPIHVVIMSGGGVDLTVARDSPRVDSITWMGYAGQAGGLAIANVIFGLYNPAGRLPVTIYPTDYVNQVSMFNMNMRPGDANPGRTYKFYTGEAVYEFGHGLSYTTFSYDWGQPSKISVIDITTLMKTGYNDRTITDTYRVNVTNTGMVAGDDIVLAYVKATNLPKFIQPPLKQLFGFERIHLNVGETQEVFFPLTIRVLLSVGKDGSTWLHPGTYKIFIGNDAHISCKIKLVGISSRWA